MVTMCSGCSYTIACLHKMLFMSVVGNSQHHKLVKHEGPEALVIIGKCLQECIFLGVDLGRNPLVSFSSVRLGSWGGTPLAGGQVRLISLTVSTPHFSSILSTLVIFLFHLICGLIDLPCRGKVVTNIEILAFLYRKIEKRKFQFPEQ